MLNSLVSGERQRANFMRQNSFEFDPKAKVIIACNQLPAIPKAGYEGLKRRLVVIECDRKPAKPDLNLAQILRNEYPQLVYWLICQANDYASNGLPPVPTL